MDAKSIGEVIATLRKKHNMTQSDLADKLHVSNKTVSKWESGQGFPEILQFPVMAELFGVSIDYMMASNRKGIVIAGNILTDIVKNIDCYPKVGMLANIRSVSQAVGGCVPNTAINLAKIDRGVPLTALGRVGNDDHGRYVISRMQHYGIDTEKISVSHKEPTSFSDVMSMPSGDRTFFHARGANTEFCPDDIDLSALNCRILHIGYILLLDRFDAVDDTYGTVMAHFLHDAQQRGIKTSVDTVSDSSGDYKNKILPALQYCNYAIVNEIESCNIWGLSPRKADGTLDVGNIRATMEKMAEQGVSDKIIVHSKEAGFCYSVATGEFTAVPSLKINREEIKGSVGAGDAYCAASLYGIYNHFSDCEILEFASAAAACNLFSENSVDGMKSKSEILEMMKNRPRLTMDCVL